MNGIALSAADGLLTTQNVIGSNNDGVLDNLEGNLNCLQRQYWYHFDQLR